MELNLFGKTRPQLFELCSDIENYLIENSRLIYPTIFFKSELFNTNELKEMLSHLKEIVIKHKGQIVDKIEEADHVVYPPSLDEKEEIHLNEYVKIVRKRDQDILVHRLCTPDSQDHWLTDVNLDAATLNNLIEMSASAGSAGGDIWEVSASWILDTDVFNEWTNQEDYEIDGELVTTEAKIKLKRSPNSFKTMGDVILEFFFLFIYFSPF